MIENFYTYVAEIFWYLGSAYQIFVAFFGPFILLIVDITAFVVMIRKKIIAKTILSIILMPPIILFISPHKVGEAFFWVWTIVFVCICFLIIPSWLEIKRKRLPFLMIVVPVLTAFQTFHFMLVVIWVSWV